MHLNPDEGPMTDAIIMVITYIIINQFNAHRWAQVR